MESVNLTVPLRVAKDIPVLNSLLSPILASNCPLPPVAGGSVPDSGSDGGPLLNLSNTELVADLEGFGRLNIIDPADNKYQFRTRRTNMADNIQESSPEDLFEESESDFKMPSHSGPIVWKGDPDLPGVRIRELSVNIRKCTTVSGEGHVEEEQSIIDSIMESVNLTLEVFGRLSLINPIPQSDEHVSDNNYQF